MKETNGRFFQSQDRCQIVLSNEALYLDETAVIRKVRGRFESMEAEYISSIFDLRDGAPNASNILEKLRTIAWLLRAGRKSEAILLATFTECYSKRQKSAELSSDLSKYNFDPFEPRDDYGQWAKDDQFAAGRASIIDVAYPGTYHDQLLADSVKLLREKGFAVVTEIRITGLNGVTARADAIVRPVGGNPHILEIKTGADPTFTAQQDAVYPLVCTGPHAISPDAKISQIGYSAGDLLPQMDVWIVYSPGPGQKTIYFNGCDVPAIWRR